MGLLFVVKVGWSRGVNEVNMCRKLGNFVLFGGQMWVEMSFFEGWERDFGAKLTIFGYFLLTLQSQSILF